MGKIKKSFSNNALDLENQDYWGTYGYGKTKEKLKMGREVEGNSSSIYSTVIQQSISTTTIMAVNPGFVPKYIEFTVYNNGSPGASSHTIYDVSTGTAKGSNISYSFNGSYINPNYADFTSTNSIFRIDEYNTTNNIRARIENLSTSFDINFYEVEFTGYITIMIKCF